MDITKLIIDNEIWILIGMSVVLLILLITSIVTIVKLNKLKKKYNYFMGGEKNKTIEELLTHYINKVGKVEKNNIEINNELNNIRKDLCKSIKKVGVIRYNAFGNMGGDLCYAIALLDEYEDGIVLNGIHSREGTYTYAKPIIKGKSNYTLSKEELEAIEKARVNNN